MCFDSTPKNKLKITAEVLRRFVVSSITGTILLKNHRIRMAKTLFQGPTSVEVGV